MAEFNNTGFPPRTSPPSAQRGRFDGDLRALLLRGGVVGFLCVVIWFLVDALVTLATRAPTVAYPPFPPGVGP